VFKNPTLEVGGDASVKSFVFAFEDVDEKHSLMNYRDCRDCKSLPADRQDYKINVFVVNYRPNTRENLLND